MRMSDRTVSDQEKIETYDEIRQMYLDTYNNPIRKEFTKYSRGAQAGHDLGSILRQRMQIMPGDPQQRRMEI